MKINFLKKSMVVILLASMIFSVLLTFQNYAEASMPDISTIEGAGDASTANSVEKIVGAILYITKVIAVGVGLIMLTAVAIKYMSSAPGERATIKKHAVVYVVGACVLFGAAGILNIIQKFATNIKST
jgi:hypothetical protein